MKLNIKKFVLPMSIAMSTIGLGSIATQQFETENKIQQIKNTKPLMSKDVSMALMALGMIGLGACAGNALTNKMLSEKSNKYSRKYEIAKENEQHFNKKERAKYLKEVDNKYLEANPQLANYWFDRLTNMKYKSYMKDLYNFDIEEVKKILANINEDNQATLDAMLSVKYDGQNNTFGSHEFAKKFKIFSECDTELAQKLINMIAYELNCASYTEGIKTMVEIVKKYPLEAKLVSNDFSPYCYNRLFNYNNLEELLESINKCNDNNKGIVNVLLSPRSSKVNNKDIQKILNTDLGLTAKQALTLFGCQSNKIYSIDEVLARLEKSKDKPLDQDSRAFYQDIYKFIQNYTGKKLTQNDLNIQSYSNLSFLQLTEDDVVSSIDKLKELELYKDDTNILTMLTKTQKLKNMQVTPDIKDFALYLENNELIEEGIIVDILDAIKGKDSEVINSKINFAKRLVENSDVEFNSIATILNNLSFTDKNIVNKQVEMLELAINSQQELELFSDFLNTNDVKEIDLYIELINSLFCNRKLNRIDYQSGLELIRNIKNLSINNKFDIVAFATTLLNKGVSPYNIFDLVRIFEKGRYDDNKQKEFISLYMKSFDYDLGDLGSIYNDILRIQIDDTKKINLYRKLGLYDKLIKIGDKEKAILQNIGINYGNLVQKIINSLGVKRNLVIVSDEQIKNFMKQIVANNNPKAESTLKKFDFAQYGKAGLPLKYSRQEFNENVEKLLKSIDAQDIEIVMKHFGLENGNVGFEGLLNNAPLDNKNVSSNTIKVAKKIQKEIENFTINNEVMVADENAKEVLDALIKGCPEFTSIIGKKQHETHAYSVDIHTLKVLQSAMNDPLYQSLNNREKTIIKFSILLHDLAKKGGVVDKEHASLGADYAWSILDRYSLSSGTKDKIIDIIDNHHWFEKYNTESIDATDVAVRCRRLEDLNIYKIFSKADFENVNSEFHFQRTGKNTQSEFVEYMNSKFKKIEDAVNDIYTKANLVFDTSFMHNGRQFPVQTIKINNKEEKLKVLNLSTLNDNESLEKFGFAKGVTKDSARFFVHMTTPDFKNLSFVLKLSNIPTNQGCLSTSMIKVSNNRTFAQQRFGFILDEPQSNISEAYYKNIATGGRKNIDAFKILLFADRFSDIHRRSYVKENFIEEMRKLGYDLNDSDYSKIVQFMFNKKYISQIREDVNVGDKIIVASDLISALEKSREALFEDSDKHSEIVALNPKVKGLIAKVSKLEECPQEFLKFAKEHDLPIVLMEPKV